MSVSSNRSVWVPGQIPHLVSQVAFTPALLSPIELDPGAFIPLVRLVLVGLNESETSGTNQTTRLWCA